VAEGEDAEVIVVGVSEEHGRRIRPASTTFGALHHAPCAVAVAPRRWRDADRPLTRIGLAYDGEPEARAALDGAMALLGQSKTPIDRVEIVRVTVPGHLDPLPLDDVRARVAGLESVEDVELHGDPAAELVLHADHLDLLVLGSHDRGGLGRLLLGSVCRDVIEQVRTPVLVRTWRRPHGAAMLRAAAFL
jgi:nucleotide-binding universal stress UspA family protein